MITSRSTRSTSGNQCNDCKRVSQLTIELAQSEAMGQKQDPLVMLKQRELDLRAMDIQRKTDQAYDVNMNIKENEIDEQTRH